MPMLMLMLMLMLCWCWADALMWSTFEKFFWKVCGGQFWKFCATVEPAFGAVTEVFVQFVERFLDRALNLCLSCFSWKEFANFIRPTCERTKDAEGHVSGKVYFEIPSEGFSQLFCNSTGKKAAHIPYIWSILEILFLAALSAQYLSL